MYIFKVPIIERKEIAKETIEVSLGLDGKQFNFFAGQYIRLTIPELRYPDKRGNYRDFSIASSPNNHNTLQVAMRKSESGFKRTLMEVPLGTEVEITGPHGDLTLIKNSKRTVVYLVGGIGITPVMSQLRFAAEEKSDAEFILFNSNTSEETAVYLEELETLTKNLPHFTVENIFGLIEEKHIRERILSVMEITAPSWYLSGPPQMLDALYKILFDHGLSEKDIHCEMFLGYESGISIESQTISRRLASTEQDVSGYRMSRAETLLKALESIALVSEDDVEGTITFVNDKFVEISKYSREELIGQNHRLLKSGHHPQSFYKDLWKTISCGLVWRGEIKNKAKDGSFYWVDAVISPVLGTDGRPRSYVAARFPITDRKKLEEVSAKEEAILDSIGDGFYCVDTDSTILIMNKVAGELIGVSPDECVGKKYYDIFVAKDNAGATVPAGNLPIHTALTGGQTTATTTDYYLVHKDGTQFPSAMTITPIILDGDIIGAINIFRDITREKEIDRAKDEFVSLASHQLRTPPTSINWFLEMLLTGDAGPLNEKQEECVRGAYQNSQRMVTLVNTLLDISRMELGVFPVIPEPVDMIVFTKDIFEEFKLTIKEKELTVKEQYAPHLPLIPVDRKLLRIVVQNIISNAVKYSPTKGTIRITVSLQKEGTNIGGRKLTIDSVVISISDTGYGIPRDQFDKIFTKLFRADNVKDKATDGIGLGLYLAKSIVDRVQGDVWFESVENKGSTFYLSLPSKGMEKKE
ncbi:PAS domain-containing protein [Candidatus Uhrbacteria bacterium]|nr:PAS domain-containing protein [Candidatus Uhrbacteria bacterium]